MEVLITSKTKWSDKRCIGGMEIETGRFVRLMTSTGEYQPSNSPFEISQIWDITYDYHPAARPHIEDVRITSRNYIGTIDDLPNYIIQRCNVWSGDYNTLFNGNLTWTSGGSGFLHKKSSFPENSVGFWVSDRDLTWDGNKYYVYRKKTPFLTKRIPYKGIPDPRPVISSGTLIRISLAKWWPKDNPRCYLQLSGWY